MERAIVSSVVGRLGDLLINEATFLAGVCDQVEQLLVELKRMQCFLEDTDYAIHDDDDADARIINRAAEIRELAYEAEAIIETFMIKVAPKGKGAIQKALNLPFIHKVGCQIQIIKDKIADLTRSLKTYSTGGADQVTSLAYERQLELRCSYHHVVDEDFVGFEEDLNTVVNHLVEPSFRHTYDRLVVMWLQMCVQFQWPFVFFTGVFKLFGMGFYWAIMVVIGAFSVLWWRLRKFSSVSDYRIVSICGMGGLGKTTLARRVYHHKDVRSHFDGFAWACISQQCQTRNILQGILCELVPEKKEEVARMTSKELFEQLYQVQKIKKCLVVLDDIWSVEAWDSLKPAFPVEKRGSKILLTTRNQELASKIHRCYFLHKPRCLNEEESWALFGKKALLRREGTESRVDRNMEALGRQMVKRCGGLPLAINVFGGLLATKNTSMEWEVVFKKVKSCGWIEDDGVSKVLALSYYDLPYQLKPCFLYFSYFPEDAELRAEKLYHLWMAEGFLSTEDRDKEETMMDVAERYLSALAQRCMVRVSVDERTGRIQYCHIHDILRDLCISKAKKHNFLKTVYLQRGTDEVDCFSTCTTKIRRLAIHLGRDAERVVLPFLESTPQLRSILFFNPNPTSYEGVSKEKMQNFLRTIHPQGETDQVDCFSTSTTKIRGLAKIHRLAIHLGGDAERVVLPNLESTSRITSILVVKPDPKSYEDEIDRPSLQLNSHFKKLKLLRTLDLEGFDFHNMSLEVIGELLSLRYLSFRESTSIRKLPQSIFRLRYLETLDLRTRFTSIEVIVLNKMERLRHLYLAYYGDFVGKFILDELSNLETLDGFDTRTCDVNDLCKLTNLRQLKANFHSSENCNKDLAAFIDYLSMGSSHLRQTSLGIFGCNFSSEEELILVRQLFGCHHLYELKIGGVIRKLPQCQFFSTGLATLSLEKCELEEDPMPTLERLPNLRSLVVRDCSVDKMVISAQGFPKLECLVILSHSNLKELTVEKGAMPNLDVLKLQEPTVHFFPSNSRGTTHERWINSVLASCSLSSSDHSSNRGRSFFVLSKNV